MDKQLSGAGLHWINASDNEIVSMLMLGLTLLMLLGLFGAFALRYYLSTRHKFGGRMPLGKK